jgi:plastocyanin
LNTNCVSTATVSCSSPSTPLISPAASVISVGQTVTYTVSNTQTGVLYVVEDANNGGSYATSEFGNGGAETFTTQVFNTPGTYDIVIAADKLSGADCKTTATASIQVTGTLPVELVSFNGRMLNAQTQLNWKTATEINSDYFNIERSADGIHFVSIGQVKATGNSSHEVAYNFVDASPLAAFNFYRLKMVDLDGKTTFSSVIKLNNTKATQLVLSPNPFKQVLNIQFTVPVGGEAYIRLFDQHGRIVMHTVRSVNAGTNAIQLQNLPVLPAGNYVLEIKSGLIKRIQQIIKAE